MIESTASRSISIYQKILKTFFPEKIFPGSEDYWIERYKSGRNSGNGSYGQLAEFKAEVINNFIKVEKIGDVIEFGCGDGNQLNLAVYPSYLGFDVSRQVIALCKEIFLNDPTKQFRLLSDYAEDKADLILSLDVIYHLVEDDIFIDYMHRIFNSSHKYVLIYSSNTDENKEDHAAHVRHRIFTKWVACEKPEWELIDIVPNRYPCNGNNEISSFCDFYIYKRR